MKKLLLIAAALMLAGCTAAGADADVRFDDEAQAEVTCMKHQTSPPGKTYTDAEGVPTDAVLPVLRYYTKNGRKKYCDGADPNANDKAWAAVYVDLGANSANVASVTG